ncbi:PEP-CTERM sorting domain-containing protein [Roseomonas sp. AR75]|uniref:PEP-CTERM sorting domain-containing protein n=1 Tax=Roseomonas sp. AR75 TaxID=2562311 RepID=UPI0010C08875|nr:PEP-CTERM sorting domain-containing protein [Roseomonas sp. AR75]
MFRTAIAAGAAALSFAVALPATADTISVESIQFSNQSRQVKIVGLGVDETVNAGRFIVRTVTQQELFLWCVDIFNSLNRGIYSPPQLFETGDLTNDGATPPNPLSAAQISRVNGLVTEGDAALANPGTNTSLYSAAYQVLIWETIYPTVTFDAVSNDVDALVASLRPGTYDGGGGTLYTPILANGDPDDKQKLFGGGPDPINPVPLPGALGLFGFALAGLIVARRATA